MSQKERLFSVKQPGINGLYTAMWFQRLCLFLTFFRHRLKRFVLVFLGKWKVNCEMKNEILILNLEFDIIYFCYHLNRLRENQLVYMQMKRLDWFPSFVRYFSFIIFFCQEKDDGEVEWCPFYWS